MQDFFLRFYYLDHQNLPFIKGLGKGQGGEEYYWDSSNRKDHQIIMQYTLSGTGYFLGSGKKQTLQKGDFFLAETPGKFAYYGTDWSFLYLEFSPTIRQWLLTPSQVFQQSSDKFYQQLQGLFEQFQNQPDLSLLENARLTFDFFLALKQEMQLLKVEQNPLAKEIKNYLENHFSQDTSLEMLAEPFKLSTFKLIRLFEEAYHYPPMAYLRKYRISKSLELLWQGKSVAETAAAVGFSNSNYFAKVFKAEMGMTPTEYKEIERI